MTFYNVGKLAEGGQMLQETILSLKKTATADNKYCMVRMIYLYTWYIIIICMHVHVQISTVPVERCEANFVITKVG